MFVISWTAGELYKRLWIKLFQENLILTSSLNYDREAENKKIVISRRSQIEKGSLYK